jgi:hypothetical protein
MADILLFVPKAERDANSNLEDFIKMCRDRLTVFGENLDWYSNAWPKVGHFTVKGAPSRGYSKDQYLNSEILSFAKAYVRYQQGLKPSKLINEFKAIRCIEPALLSVKGKADITLVDTTVMDLAAQFAREYDATAYQAGSALAKMVKFLNESKIVPKRIEWRNPIAKPKEINRTDKQTQDKRAEKLPDDLQLEGMAELFANDLQHPRDRFTTSIFALLMSAPSRISEVQKLPLNVLHYDKDSEGVECLGLRFLLVKVAVGTSNTYRPVLWTSVKKLCAGSPSCLKRDVSWPGGTNKIHPSFIVMMSVQTFARMPRCRTNRCAWRWDWGGRAIEA